MTPKAISSSSKSYDLAFKLYRSSVCCRHMMRGATSASYVCAPKRGCLGPALASNIPFSASSTGYLFAMLGNTPEFSLLGPHFLGEGVCIVPNRESYRKKALQC